MTAPTVEPAEFLGDQGLQDPYPLFARLRDTAPVHRLGDSRFHLVLGWDAVCDVVNRPQDFSSNLTAAITYTPQTGVTEFPMGDLDGPTQGLATADDPAHAVHRRMVIPQLVARRIRELAPVIATTFEKLWVPDSFDWMSVVANRLPMMVVCRLIGVPDTDVDKLIDWAYASTHILDGVVTTAQLEQSALAAIQLSGYIFEQFDEAVSSGTGNDLLGDMAAAHAAGEVDQMTAAVVMVTLFSAGGESTASLLGSAVAILAEHPDIQRRLRDEPNLLGAFIEECLRFEPPFRAHYRHVRCDTDIDGIAVPAHARLLLLWGAANRDPAQFEAPEEFRLGRSGGKGHLSFGKGAHFCVGAALARLEATVVLGALLERTRWIEATEIGPWLPSVLVRRRSALRLVVPN